ncbi:hypothetical protein F2Q68_00035172 [Brassica cretica]|uniref:Reverse transcriptase domain-containing protein n=1 Tax=Brassica cretica TaxID=69181 RepID=A0A8S9H9G3_BRACR|nr:hypothetical protein F2Q68_00035172 [Brassica cretica]
MTRGPAYDFLTNTPKTEKKISNQDSRSQDSAELFWQSRNITALEEKREPTCEPVVTVCLDEASPERCVEIGANLREPLRTELITCLKKNLNTFAWAAEDMPGIDINITCHELNIDPARSLRSDRALPKRRYDISPCILVYPSMLSPEDRSEPISCFPPF